MTTNQTGIFYEERWKKNRLGFCRANDRKSLTWLHFGHHVIALILNVDPLAPNTLYNNSLAGKTEGYLGIATKQDCPSTMAAPKIC